MPWGPPQKKVLTGWGQQDPGTQQQGALRSRCPCSGAGAGGSQGLGGRGGRGGSCQHSLGHPQSPGRACPRRGGHTHSPLSPEQGTADASLRWFPSPRSFARPPLPGVVGTKEGQGTGSRGSQPCSWQCPAWSPSLCRLCARRPLPGVVGANVEHGTGSQGSQSCSWQCPLWTPSLCRLCARWRAAALVTESLRSCPRCPLLPLRGLFARGVTVPKPAMGGTVGGGDPQQRMPRGERSAPALPGTAGSERAAGNPHQGHCPQANLPAAPEGAPGVGQGTLIGRVGGPFPARITPRGLTCALQHLASPRLYWHQLRSPAQSRSCPRSSSLGPGD